MPFPCSLFRHESAREDRRRIFVWRRHRVRTVLGLPGSIKDSAVADAASSLCRQTCTLHGRHINRETAATLRAKRPWRITQRGRAGGCAYVMRSSLGDRGMKQQQVHEWYDRIRRRVSRGSAGARARLLAAYYDVPGTTKLTPQHGGIIVTPPEI